MTWCSGDDKISRLLFVHDHITGIHFLVDSGAQISIIPATEADKKKRPHKFTIQTVNKSLIQAYGQRYLTLNLGLRRSFTIFLMADVEKAILVADLLHKYSLLVDINKYCLTDPVMNVNSFGLVRKGFFSSPSMANIEEYPIFCKFLKNILQILPNPPFTRRLCLIL